MDVFRNGTSGVLHVLLDVIFYGVSQQLSVFLRDSLAHCHHTIIDNVANILLASLEGVEAIGNALLEARHLPNLRM
jgi:hypothetical protein